MVGVFHVLFSIIVCFVRSGAAPAPHSLEAVKDAVVRAIERDESLVAHSLLQTSAKLHRWGARHSAQLRAPMIAAEKAAESVVEVAKAKSAAAKDSLSHVGTSLRQWGSRPDVDAFAAPSFRKVRSHVGVSSASVGVIAAGAAQPEALASAPSLLQMSEADGGVEGGQTDVALDTQHAIMRGSHVRLSDLQGGSSESWPSLNVMALLGVIAGVAVLMLQLSSSSQPSVTGQLGGRKSWGSQLQGPMQESGACTTDRGS